MKRLFSLTIPLLLLNCADPFIREKSPIEDGLCTLNFDKLETAKANAAYAPGAKAQILVAAESALSAGPFSVTFQGPLPPSGDQKDYASLAIYWWPNPGTPDGKPYIRKDGQVNPQINDWDAPCRGQMEAAVKSLAYGWYLSADSRFGDKAAALLRTFFLDQVTGMNPRLRYAQCIPGLVDGTAAGLIETAEFSVSLVDAILLLRKTGALNDEDFAGLQNWFADYRDWLLSSMQGREEGLNVNNHGTYYHLQIAAFSLLCGDMNTVDDAIVQSVNLIGAQFLSDGLQPHELSRTKSFEYSVYNLRAWSSLSAIAAKRGYDLFNYDAGGKRSPVQGLRALLSYAGNPAAWPYPMLYPPADIASLYPVMAIVSSSCGYPASQMELLPGGSSSYSDRLENLLYPYSL